MSARTLLQIDPNSNRLDSANSSDADSMPATPSKDKFREWTFPRTKAGSGGPAVALSSSTSTGARPPFASSSKAGAGIRTGGGGSTAARRPSIATRGSSRAAAAGDFAQAGSCTTTSPATPAGAARTSGEVAHGRSSSVAPNSSPKRQRPLGSTDFRHRSNASLLTSPVSKKKTAARSTSSGTSMSFVKLNMPTNEGVPSSPTPSRFARVAVALVRRRSLGEIIYIVLFSGCIVIWAAALCGYGHTGPVHTFEAELARSGHDSVGAAAVVDVRIPDTLLPPQDRSDPDGEYLADVHQRAGDTTHDEGEDHFQASPLDPALADENAPHVHHNEGSDSLWSDHDLEDSDATAQALLGRDTDEPVHVDGLDHSHGPSRPHAPMERPAEDDDADISFDTGDTSPDDLGPDPLDPTALGPRSPAKGEDPEEQHAEERGLAEAADPEASDDEADEAVEDDSIPIEQEEGVDKPGDSGSLHVVDADDDPGAPTALDELLDSAAEEHQETLRGGFKDVPADALFRTPGTKNRKLAQKRSAKAQAQAKRAPSAATLAQRDQQGMKVIIRRE